MYLLCLCILLIGNTGLFSQDTPAMHILYTANLSGALEDCGCSDTIVGGMSRVSPFIRQFRQTHPHTLVVDGGDFLTSYTLPEVNRLMADFLSRTPYDAVNFGDQEFVESAAFLFAGPDSFAARIPFTSANLFNRTTAQRLALPVREMVVNHIPVRIIGLTSPAAFEFIRAPELNITNPEEVLLSLAPLAEHDRVLDVVLFHGEWEAAQGLLKNFPWIDVLICGHNQYLRYEKYPGSVLCESGLEGEYIGHLSVYSAADGWRFENEFLPITKDFPFDPHMQERVDRYNQELLKGLKPPEN